jgi:hypothetical protein
VHDLKARYREGRVGDVEVKRKLLDEIKEGVALERGNDGRWGAQAVDLAPAQGAIVEFVLAEDGMYPMVTHAFNFVGRGALGLFQSGDGDPKN